VAVLAVTMTPPGGWSRPWNALAGALVFQVADSNLRQLELE
jgi:hypothetical protein